MSDSDSGRRSYSSDGAARDWPETPGDLVFHLDAVLKLFDQVQSGEPFDLLDGLLACVDWREMFGSEGTGFLTQQQTGELVRYYRAKFAGIERFYLAEQLSTELMTALMASGEHQLSVELRQLGRDRPELWREIRTFFSRKEYATATLMIADSAARAGRDPQRS